MSRVYPDANVALHYRPFEEIDWLALLDAREVTIVITAIFLREVDDHKDRGRGAIQKRAKRFSAWLGKLRANKSWEIRPHVRVEVVATEPETVVDFAAHGLVATVGDDRLIACMIRDRALHPDESLTLLTADTLLTFKAEGAGFGFLMAPQEMRLADEPDARDLEVKDLQQRLIDAQKQIRPQPRLHLRFRDSGPTPVIRLGIARVPDEAEIEDALDFERQHLDAFGSVTGLMYESLSEREVADHLERIREWIPSKVDRARLEMLTHRIRLELENDGDGNAEDVEISLRFPEFVTLGHRRRLPECVRPQEPKRRHRFAKPIAELARLQSDMLHTAPFTKIKLPSRAPRWSFPKTDPHLATLRVSLIKHHEKRPLPTFDLWVDDPGVLGQRAGMKVAACLHSMTTRQDIEIDVKIDTGERGINFWKRSNVAEDDDSDDE